VIGIEVKLGIRNAVYKLPKRNRFQMDHHDVESGIVDFVMELYTEEAFTAVDTLTKLDFM